MIIHYSKRRMGVSLSKIYVVIDITPLLVRWAKKTNVGVSKNRGKTPQIIHFNRDFHDFHHPFWGVLPLFMVQHPCLVTLLLMTRLPWARASLCARTSLPALEPPGLLASRCIYECVEPKIGGTFAPKMDGENMGKPLFFNGMIWGAKKF